jgi:uncharacterized protein YegP (UPF0339 family)
MSDFKVHKIETYVDASGDHRWRAVARNGRTVADSGEGYANKFDMEEIIRGAFPDVEVVEADE